MRAALTIRSYFYFQAGVKNNTARQANLLDRECNTFAFLL
jgi:hypothetical protein